MCSLGLAAHADAEFMARSCRAGAKIEWTVARAVRSSAAASVRSSAFWSVQSRARATTPTLQLAQRPTSIAADAEARGRTSIRSSSPMSVSSLELLTAYWRLFVPVVIALASWRARFLTPSGSLAAVAVGCAVVWRGWGPTGMLLAFFLAGSIATKVRQHDKEAAMPYPETEEEEQARARVRARAQATRDGGATSTAATDGAAAPAAVPRAKKVKRGRDASQVLATGLVPAIICLLADYFPTYPVESMLATASSSDSGGSFSFLIAPPSRPLWFLTYLAFLATCCGDTLASEIGMLSTQTPLMLWRRARVSRGVDGGMTLLGTAASVAGGALVGCFGGSLFDVYLGAIYGCIGSLFDSILGTLLQSAQYRSQATAPVAADAASTAAAAAATNLNGATLRGADGFIDATSLSAPLPLTPVAWKRLNNLVNLASSLLAALVAVGVQHLHLTRGVDLLPQLLLVCMLLLLAVTPAMRPSFTVVGAGAIAALWAGLCAQGQQQQLILAAPLLVGFAVWRMRA